jgi:hypothetical protein
VHALANNDCNDSELYKTRILRAGVFFFFCLLSLAVAIHHYLSRVMLLF